MPRILTNNLIEAINLFEADSAWVWLVELQINNLPTPERYTTYDLPVTFHGNVYNPQAMKLAKTEDSDTGRLTQITAIIQNVDQVLISLIEQNWIIQTQFPRFTIKIWPIDVSQPDEFVEANASSYRVTNIRTNFETAVFTLVADGIPVNATLPKLRFTKSGGFDTFA